MSQEDQKIEKRDRNVISAVAVLTVLLFVIEIYEIINDPQNFIVLGSLGGFILVAVYTELTFIHRLDIHKTKEQKKIYNEVYRSEKATYVLMRKYFDQIEQKMDQIEQKSELPYKKILEAQKALTKIQLSKNRENISLEMHSNKAALVQGNREITAKQEQILNYLKSLEEMIQNEISESANKIIAENENLQTVNTEKILTQQEKTGLNKSDLDEILVKIEAIENKQSSIMADSNISASSDRMRALGVSAMQEGTGSDLPTFDLPEVDGLEPESGKPQEILQSLDEPKLGGIELEGDQFQGESQAQEETGVAGLDLGGLDLGGLDLKGDQFQGESQAQEEPEVGELELGGLDLEGDQFQRNPQMQNTPEIDALELGELGQENGLSQEIHNTQDEPTIDGLELGNGLQQDMPASSELELGALNFEDHIPNEVQSPINEAEFKIPDIQNNDISSGIASIDTLDITPLDIENGIPQEEENIFDNDKENTANVDEPQLGTLDFDSIMKSSERTDEPVMGTRDMDGGERATEESEEPELGALNFDDIMKTTGENEEPELGALDTDDIMKTAGESEEPELGALDTDDIMKTTGESEEPELGALDTDDIMKIAGESEEPELSALNFDDIMKTAGESEEPELSALNFDDIMKTAGESEEPELSALNFDDIMKTAGESEELEPSALDFDSAMETAAKTDELKTDLSDIASVNISPINIEEEPPKVASPIITPEPSELDSNNMQLESTELDSNNMQLESTELDSNNMQSGTSFESKTNNLATNSNVQKDEKPAVAKSTVKSNTIDIEPQPLTEQSAIRKLAKNPRPDGSSRKESVVSNASTLMDASLENEASLSKQKPDTLDAVKTDSPDIVHLDSQIPNLLNDNLDIVNIDGLDSFTDDLDLLDVDTMDPMMDDPMLDSSMDGFHSVDPGHVMSADEIAALIANTDSLSIPEPDGKKPQMPDLSNPGHVMSADEIAALIANM